MQMNISPRGVALIQVEEGLRMDAYPDPGTGGEPWTIGYGHTGGVKPRDRITHAQADAFLRADLQRVEACIGEKVRAAMTQAMYDALCSFVFNVGCGAFAKSTLLRKLNAGDFGGAAAEFGRWINAGGKPLPGLVRRRKHERDLFVSDGPPQEPTA